MRTAKRISFVLCAALVALVPLPAFAQITGTVMTSEGAPLAGVMVRAHAQERSSELMSRLVSEDPTRKILAEVKSDDRGRFSIAVSAQDVVDLTFSLDGYAPAAVAFESKGELGAIPLKPAKLVTGTVRASGKAVAGATVRWHSGITEFLTRTDEKGRFRVPDPAVWHPEVFIRHDAGYHITSRERHVDGYIVPSLNFDVAMTKLSGSFVRPDGSPIANAAAMADSIPVGTTGADGRFDLLLPPSWKRLRLISGEQLGVRMRSQKQTTIKPMVASTFGGRITDGAGKALAGVRVELTAAQYRGETIAATLSARDGSYELRSLIPGSYRITVSRPRFLLATSDLIISAGATKKNFALARGVDLNGVVRDEEKRPVPGAVIRDDEGMRSLTGPDGRFVGMGVPGTKAKLVAAKRGFPDARSDSIDLRSGARREEIVIIMRRGFEVKGRVVDATGEPVAGVRIGHASSPDLPDWDFDDENVDPVVTSGDGSFALRVSRGTWFLFFRRAGFVRTMLDGKLIESDVNLEPVILHKGVSVSGRVVRKNGTPVSEATFWVNQGEVAAMSRTGEDGAFHIADLRPGKTDIFVTKRDGTRATRQIDAPAEDVIIEVPDLVMVRGRVIDADGRKPLTDFELGVGRQQNPGGRTREPIHSPDGTFTLDIAPSDDLVITAKAPGYIESRHRIEVKDGEVAPLEISLKRGVRVWGRVTDPSARPLPRVIVHLQKKRHTGFGGTYTAIDQSSLTDADGGFSFGGVESTDTQIAFMKTGFLRVTRGINPSEDQQRIDVQLERGLAIRGVVVSETGTPVANASVSAWREGADESSQYETTDSEGRFELEPLRSGERFRVSAAADGFVSSQIEDVETGGDRELRLQLKRGGTIAGRVTGLSEGDLSAVVIQLDGSWEDRKVSPSGTFRIDGVEPGNVNVKATLIGRGIMRMTRAQRVQVTAGELAEVELEFQAGHSLRGIVTKGTERMAGVTVSFIPKGGSHGFVETTTDSSGAYEVSGLLDDLYEVTVRHREYYASFRTTHEVRGSGTFDIQVTTHLVYGRVVGARREPIDGAMVGLSTKAEGDMPSIVGGAIITDANGSFSIEGGEGEQILTVRKSGFATVVRDIDVGREKTSDLEIVLEKSKNTVVRAVDSRNGAVLRPDITIYDEMGRHLSTAESSPAGDGTVSLDVADGSYLIVVFAPPLAPRTVRITVPSELITVALEPGGSVEIIPPEGKKFLVTIRDSLGVPFHAAASVWAHRVIGVEGVTPIHLIAPGTYSVEAVAASGGESRKYTIRVEAGKKTELRLE